MTNLAYDRAGVGPPLVLLHPLGADRRVWQPVLGRLSRSRDCIAVDLPGFGQSPSLSHDPHPRGLARAVQTLLDELGLADGRAHLAGNSLGGWVALEAALQGPVASVTAIAPAGLWPQPLPPKPEVGRRLAQLSRPLLAQLLNSVRLRSAILGGSVGHPERVPVPAAVALVLAYAGAPGFTAANRAMRGGTFGQLEAIDVPITLVWPELDRLVSRPRTLPASVRELELPDCGHIPMWDDPEAVTLALLAGSATDTAAAA
jgi:pimeloyl-ACP methyl ester carboxylesterase